MLCVLDPTVALHAASGFTVLPSKAPSACEAMWGQEDSDSADWKKPQCVGFALGQRLKLYIQK